MSLQPALPESPEATCRPARALRVAAKAAGPQWLARVVPLQAGRLLEPPVQAGRVAPPEPLARLVAPGPGARRTAGLRPDVDELDFAQ